MKKIILILLITLIPTLSHAGFSVHKDGIHQSQMPERKGVFLDWHGEAKDTNDEFNLDTGEFCPLTSGTYSFTIGVHWKDLPDNAKVCVGYKVNGARGNYACNYSSGGRKHFLGFTTFVDMEVGDCIASGVTYRTPRGTLRSNVYILGEDVGTWWKGELLR